MAPRSRSTRSADNTAHIALLRGINVGGKNILPMIDLAAMFCKAGCANVRTYIQSGNVVFASSPALAARIPKMITAAIDKRFGFQPLVMICTGREIEAVIEANPFLNAKVD